MIFLKKKPLPTWLEGKNLTVNGVFEKVLVCNLDRRPDRLAWVTEQCKAVGIEFERVVAVDGRDEKWREKLTFPVLQNRPDAGEPYGVAALNETMRNTLQRAIKEQWQSFLWIEDDNGFFRNFNTRFARGISGVEDNWRVVHGGAIFGKITYKQIIWYSPEDHDHSMGDAKKMTSPWCLCNFIAFNHSIFQEYLEELSAHPEKAIDWFSFDTSYGCYVFVPALVYQERGVLKPDLSNQLSAKDLQLLALQNHNQPVQ
jgi:hypothetical protein